jgi:hypothetical protein
LTANIKQANTAEELQQLLQRHSASFNHIHLGVIGGKLGNRQQEGMLICDADLQEAQQLLADIEQLPQLPQLLAQCECRHLSQLVWGLGLLGHTHTGLFAACLDGYMQIVGNEERAQHVSSVLYGAAKAEWQLQNEQLQLLLAALVRLLPDADPKAVSSSLGSIAKMAGRTTGQQQHLLQQSPYLQQLLAGLAGKLPAAGAQAVSTSLWACAQLRIYPAALFAALDSQQQWDRLLPAMNGQHLVGIAHACAMLDHRDEQLLGGVLCQALQLQRQSSSSSSRQLTVRSSSNLSWSLAVLDLQQLAGDIVELMQAQVSGEMWDLEDKGMVQLQLVHQWLLDRQLVGGRGLAGALTEQQLQQCREASAASLKVKATEAPGQFKRDILAALQQLTAAGALSWQQQPALQQLAVPDGACLIDIGAVTADGLKLAIEADGPTHFLWPNNRLNGSTQHRNRVLEARGYAVVSVPYFEWHKWRPSKRQQQQPSDGQVQLLLQLMQAATQTSSNSRGEQPRPLSLQPQHGTRISSAQEQPIQLKGKQLATQQQGAAAAGVAFVTSRSSLRGRVRRIRQRTAE